MMLKALLKKQLLELNRSFFQNRKTGQAKSRAIAAASIFLFLALMVFVIGGMFFYLSWMLRPLIAGGLGWLYFAITGMISILFGVFGSVFNTYSSLYQAKDNDLLLSMPIPVRYILLVRLAGVYLMGLLYSGVVSIPAAIVFYLTAAPQGLGYVSPILFVLILSLVVLILSCLLGWVVAKISGKLKNKSFITVILSLVFLGAYYYLYFRANEALQNLLANAAVLSQKIKGAAYPLYVAGRGAEGDAVSLGLMAAVVLALTVAVCLMLAHNFIKLATQTGVSSSGSSKKALKKGKAKGLHGALLSREGRRYASCPAYILNCSLGTLFMVAASVMLLIKGTAVRQLMQEGLGLNGGILTAIACAGVCMLASMNDLTAPSISLEGKTLWLMQSLPVDAWQVLRAKLKLHLLLTVPPALFCSICVAIVLRLELGATLLVMVLPVVFALFTAAFGLMLNLKMPHLDWTSETVAVKQGGSVMLALLGSWLMVILFVGLYFLMDELMSPTIYLLVCLGLLAVLTFGLLRWLKARGTKIFYRL